MLSRQQKIIFPLKRILFIKSKDSFWFKTFYNIKSKKLIKISQFSIVTCLIFSWWHFLSVSMPKLYNLRIYNFFKIAWDHNPFSTPLTKAQGQCNHFCLVIRGGATTLSANRWCRPLTWVVATLFMLLLIHVCLI